VENKALDTECSDSVSIDVGHGKGDGTSSAGTFIPNIEIVIIFDTCWHGETWLSCISESDLKSICLNHPSREVSVVISKRFERNTSNSSLTESKSKNCISINNIGDNRNSFDIVGRFTGYAAAGSTISDGSVESMVVDNRYEPTDYVEGVSVVADVVDTDAVLTLTFGEAAVAGVSLKPLADYDTDLSAWVI
jgi:hypothetical protein